MTTEHFEEQLRAHGSAVHLLSDTVADFLLNRGHAAKIGEIASQAGKRIGAGAKLIRQALADNPQFVGEERRWNLALRTLFHRPIEGALRDTLRLYGRPLHIKALSNEMAVLSARAPEYFQGFLPPFMANRPELYFELPDGRWALTEWLLDTDVIDEDELIMKNFFFTREEVQPILEKAAQAKVSSGMSAGDAALAVLQTVGEPVPTKVLSYALWRVRGADFDAKQFYIDLVEDDRVHMLSGAQWMPADQLPVLTASLQQLSAIADQALEEEETWEGPYMASPEDLNEIFDYMVEHDRPQKLTELIEAVLEYGKASPRFMMIYDGLMDALREDPRFQLVGAQTWTLPALIPQEVMQVPESLLPETVDPSFFSDPEADAELEDEGLEDQLPLWVHDPRYEDFGGEHEVELSAEFMEGASTVGETRIPLLYNHHRMGTLKLRQADMSFFPTDTPMACVTVHGENAGPFQMWINNEELLIHGLADWYRAREVPVGAMLTFRRGEEADEFALSWEGESDELIALSSERIATLLTLRESAEQEHWSIYEIMVKVLADHPEGLHFLSLWAEVNVARRTPKRVVASNLSSYHCFAMISGTERWRLDERKVEQGRKKTKKKFIIE